MKIKIIGSRGENPVPDNRIKKHASILVKHRGTKIQFDAGNPPEDRIDALFITHAHPDHIKCIDQYKSVPIYTPPDVKIKGVATNTVKDPVKIGEVTVTPFPVPHSKLKPTYGYFIEANRKVAYIPDISSFTDKVDGYLRASDAVLLDGSTWNRDFRKSKKVGHIPIKESIEHLHKLGVPAVYYIHIGKNTAKNVEKCIEYCRQYIPTTNICFDGMEIETFGLEEHVIEETLFERHDAIYLTPPHARLIWTGAKTLIVKAKNFSNMVGKLLYLIDDTYCYGIIRLKKPKQITLPMFRKLLSKHRITEEERQRWWKHKEILFAYEFDFVKRFEKPVRVKVPKGTQTFVHDFKFLNDETLSDTTSDHNIATQGEMISDELIQNIAEYDPSTVGNKQLADDWRIVCAWYASKKQGKKLKHSLETIINLAKLIYEEIVRRVKAGKMKHEFKPEKMTKYARELYSIVSRKDILNSEKDVKEIVSKLDDMTILKDVICLVGSTVEKEEHNDVDFLVRLDPEYDYLRRAILARIHKIFPDAHVFFEPLGPHGNYVPLYDLVLKKKEHEIVKMAESSISLMKPFLPMKPRRRFYQVDEIVRYMFETGEKYAVEKKFNGFRGVIHRSGDRVKIFSDQGKDITSAFPTIVDEAKKFSKRNFIVDVELVLYKNKKPQGRAEIAKYIGAVKSGKKIDDSGMVAHVFDCVYYDDKPINDLKWYERKKILNSQFKDTSHIKKVHSILVTTPEEAERAIKGCDAMLGSEGAMVKRFEGIYTPNKKTDAWIKFRHEVPIKARVIEVHRVKGEEHGWNYTVGIDLSERQLNVVNEKYVVDLDGKKVLRLGNTFNTSIRASVGDVLRILVEEIWRHVKDGKFRYSIHKPDVDANLGRNVSTSTVKELDDYVVARGLQVVENIEQLSSASYFKRGILELKSDGEGREVEVRDFPKLIQRDFKKNEGKWLPFVMQWHYRGHRNKDGSVTMGSLHTDFRLRANNHLDGITILSPTSTDERVPDLLHKGEDARRGRIRCVMKLPEPVPWLNVEGIAKVGTPGSTPRAPGVFVIVAKGKYMPILAEDHRLVFKLKCDKGKVNYKVVKQAEKAGINLVRMPPKELKDLDGVWEAQIAHIGDRHIILLRYLGDELKKETR